MVLVTARLSHVTPSAISDRSSRGKLKKKIPSAECIVLPLVMSVEWLSCPGSKWLASIGIPLLVVQPSSWLGLTWVPYPSVPSLGFHWVPASCFWVLLHDFPGSFHVYFFFCWHFKKLFHVNFSLIPLHCPCNNILPCLSPDLGLFQSLVFFCVPSTCFVQDPPEFQDTD